MGEEDRNQLITLGSQPFHPMGRAMKEYIIFPAQMFENLAQLQTWIQKSLDFVTTKSIKYPKRTKITT